MFNGMQYSSAAVPWLPWRGIVLCRFGLWSIAQICQGTATWLWPPVRLGLGCRGVPGTRTIPAGTTSWPGFGSTLGWIHDRLLRAWDGTRQLLERLSSVKTENNGNPSSSEGALFGDSGLQVSCQEVTDVCPSPTGRASDCTCRQTPAFVYVWGRKREKKGREDLINTYFMIITAVLG